MMEQPMACRAGGRRCQSIHGMESPIKVSSKPCSNRLAQTCFRCGSLSTSKHGSFFASAEVFQAAHGDWRARDLGDALTGFAEGSLDRCLHHALLQFVRERACGQLQGFIQRMDAVGAGPGVLMRMMSTGPKMVFDGVCGVARASTELARPPRQAARH